MTIENSAAKALSAVELVTYAKDSVNHVALELQRAMEGANMPTDDQCFDCSGILDEARGQLERAGQLIAEIRGEA
jgi:hypothetical protein